jgi:hypothetical protein
MSKGWQQQKFTIIGALFGTERSTFVSTAEATRHVQRANNFVGFGRYTFADQFPQAREGTITSGTKGTPVITQSPI